MSHDQLKHAIKISLFRPKPCFFGQNNSFTLVNMKLISVKRKYGKHITRNSRSSTDLTNLVQAIRAMSTQYHAKKHLTSWFTQCKIPHHSNHNLTEEKKELCKKQFCLFRRNSELEVHSKAALFISDKKNNCLRL